MMTVILENEKNEKVKHLFNEDSGKYLFNIEDYENFPIISEFADCDNEIVTHEQIEQLINELNQLKFNLNKQDSLHIDEIIKLADEVKKNKNYYLVFTPFKDVLKSNQREVK